MLMDSIKSNLELINEVNKKSENIAQKEHFNKLYKKFESLERRFNKPIYSSTHIKYFFKDIDLNNINYKIDKLISYTSYLINNIENMNEVRSNKIGVLVEKTEDIDDSIKDYWQNTMISRNESIDNTLNLIENIIDDKLKILKLKKNIRDINRNWPVSKQNIDNYKIAIEQGNKLIKDLNVDGNIQNFLELVSNQEATLEHMDNEILEWLKKQNLLYKIKVIYSK